MTPARKKLLRTLTRAVLYPLLALAFYVVLIEPDWVKRTEYDLRDLPRFSPAITEANRPGGRVESGTTGASPAPTLSPITIAQLSDLHMDKDHAIERVRKAAQRLAEIKPDLIALTGDFYSGHIHNRPKTVEVLRMFPAIAPTYAVAGNHDGGIWVAQHGGYRDTTELNHLLTESGISFLLNQTVHLTPRGRQIELYGAGDLWSDECAPPPPDASNSADGFERIVLVHNPDARTTFNTYPWKLMLCGHTHGGQVVIPFFGAPILPVRKRAHASGLFREAPRATIITTGLGNLLNVRFNCRPEIVLVRL